MSNFKKIATTLLLASGALYGTSRILKKQPVLEVKPYFKRRSPYLFAHRGGLGLRPEHTKLAFDNALNLNVDGFEIDIRLTKDEEIVVFHDTYIDRVSNGSGKVSEFTLEELRTLDFGYHFKDQEGNYPYRGHKDAKIITLSDLIDNYPDVLINIEIKDELETRAGGIVVKKLYDLLEEKNCEERVLVTSFHDDQIMQFNLYGRNKYAIGAGVREVIRSYLYFISGFGHLYTSTRDTFQLPVRVENIRLDLKPYIHFMKNLNVAMGYWVINDVEKMSELLDKGVHTIVTDYPDKAYYAFKNKFN